MSSLFLLPSEIESFGLSALEAMAAKVPVVSSNIGGIPEVNIHNFTGMLSDVGNISEMAKFSIELLKDKNKLNLLRENAHEHAKKFDIHKIVPKYEDVYKKLVK